MLTNLRILKYMQQCNLIKLPTTSQGQGFDSRDQFGTLGLIISLKHPCTVVVFSYN